MKIFCPYLKLIKAIDKNAKHFSALFVYIIYVSFGEEVKRMRMKISAVLLWLTGLAEAFLAIPFLGGSLVISTGYSVLGVMFVFHLITLFFCFREYSPKSGSILGIITSLLAWIPLIGWAMHLLTAVVLIFSAVIAERRRTRI